MRRLLLKAGSMASPSRPVSPLTQIEELGKLRS